MAKSRKHLEKLTVFTCRIPERDYQLVLKLCEARRITQSDFVRVAIAKELAFYGLLSAEEAELLQSPKKEDVKIE